MYQASHLPLLIQQGRSISYGAIGGREEGADLMLQIRYALAQAVPVALSSAVGTAAVMGAGNLGAVIAGAPPDGCKGLGRLLGCLAMQPLHGAAHAGLIGPLANRMTAAMLPVGQPIPQPNVNRDNILWGVAIFSEMAKSVVVAAVVPACTSMAVFVAIELGATFTIQAASHLAMTLYSPQLEWPASPAGRGTRNNVVWGVAAGFVDAISTVVRTGYACMVQVRAPESYLVAGIIGGVSAGITGYFKSGLQRLQNFVPSTSASAYATYPE